MITGRYKYILIFAALLMILVVMTRLSYFENPEEPVIEATPTSVPLPTPPPVPTATPTVTPPPEPEATPTPVPLTVTITAAGDVTFGGHEGSASYSTFMREFRDHKSDFGFYFSNFAEIFADSDVTVVNLEGALTDLTAHSKSETGFALRAPPEFATALYKGNVDVVSLANNHTLDFGPEGKKDTKDALDAVGVAYFGESDIAIVEANGVKVGFFGYLTWNHTTQHANNIASAINRLKADGAQIIVGYFHWGAELDEAPTADQKKLGRHAIDAGAHLVLGAHPHTIQGIEVYKGRNIVYSLGNFSFAGNRNPLAGLDTFVFQQTFTFDNNGLISDNVTNIIPARITSEARHNNYQPTPATGEDAERILAKLEKFNQELNG